DYVSAWSGQNRNHLFIDDLDGDGKLEVASEVNGTWNRITIWDAAGTAIASANFGPGPAAPFKTVRALDLADLNGDGVKELVAAVADGLVVALDAKCQPLWSTRLASPAATLTALAGGRLLAGCDDGSVVVMDGQGTVQQVGKVDSRPAEARLLPNGHVLLATDKGQVTALQP
ncbi:MAG: PQQ-binding-like beta-propeller repeat protein, partial [Armatimonadetes bacterium]|nr:PQQ-binding-like beta-propeller repeat protein [Armatimonadota bacterium]